MSCRAASVSDLHHELPLACPLLTTVALLPAAPPLLPRLAQRSLYPFLPHRLQYGADLALLVQSVPVPQGAGHRLGGHAPALEEDEAQIQAFDALPRDTTMHPYGLSTSAIEANNSVVGSAGHITWSQLPPGPPPRDSTSL